MRRHADDRHSLVWRYGALSPLSWGDSLNEQLFLQNKLWNKLVEIERAHRDQYRAIIGEVPEIAEAERLLAGKLAQRDALKKERRAMRQKAQAKVKTPFLDDEIRRLAEAIKPLKVSLKALRQELRERVRPQLDQLEIERRALIKEARQNSGLWWANYNAVIDAYQNAQMRALKSGAQLKFHAFDGAGRFTAQIQGGMSVQDLFEGKRSEVQIDLLGNTDFARMTGRGGGPQIPTSERTRRQKGLLKITAFTHKEGKEHKRVYLHLPIILHRPFPENARIKSVSAVRRRIGRRFHWHVCFTLNEPRRAVEHPGKSACALHFGWKKTAEGLRVATRYDTHGECFHLTLPEKFMRRYAWCDKLAGRMDEAINALKALLSAEIKGAPEPLTGIFKKIKKSKRPIHLYRLVWIWCGECPEFRPDILERIEAWRIEDDRMRRQQVHLKAKLIRQREDIYRNFAKACAENYALMAVDDVDLSRLAVTEQPSGEETPLHQQARYQRFMASVSVLREWLVKQAAKTGAEVSKIAAPVTVTCHRCGRRHARGLEIVVHCGCGAIYDVDVNAAQNLLTALTGEPEAIREKLIKTEALAKGEKSG